MRHKIFLMEMCIVLALPFSAIAGENAFELKKINNENKIFFICSTTADKFCH